MIPYFGGEKRALCVDMRKSTAYPKIPDFRAKARTPKQSTKTSVTRVIRMIDCLEKRSASVPDVAAKSKKGRTKTPPASANIVLLCSIPLRLIKKKARSNL